MRAPFEENLYEESTELWKLSDRPMYNDEDFDLDGDNCEKLPPTTTTAKIPPELYNKQTNCK